MIKELKAYRKTPSGYKHPENLIQDKINEIIETVNELVLCEQMRTCYELIHKDKTEDLYAEQRQWIGKLCWFWNDNKADKVIGILTGVFDEADRPFERNIDQTLYKHCEPVSPDDDIIFKKEEQ